VLLPFAMAYRTVMSTRARAYARGWLKQRPLPLPAVAIGNLAVGGAGKTPFAANCASRLRADQPRNRPKTPDGHDRLI